jgi:predicted metal-binding membrane protein
MVVLSPLRSSPAEALSPQASSRRTVTMAAAGSATVLLAVAAWVVALRQMSGMDMGPGTGLGSLSFFVALWVPMMAAMMLPGAVPAVWRHARAVARLRAVPVFLVLYLAVWALVGMAVYALYRPHGYVAAGAATIAAGVYELTPLKVHFRRRCHETARSGLQFGLCCVGSSLGLMLMFVALGIMSVTWMAVVAVLVGAQKVLPAKAALDMPVGLAIVGLGALIVAAPSAVPGLVASM